MVVFLSFLIASLPSYHPEAPIQCVQYYPGTDIVLPKGVTFNYTPTQKILNALRCYCEIVKLVETNCLRRGFSRASCISKTKEWANQNLSIAKPRPGQLPPVPRRNFMINVQTSP